MQKKKSFVEITTESQKNPDHIYIKRGIFLAFFLENFLGAIFWSVWPNPITNLFRIFLQDISEALGLRLATVGRAVALAISFKEERTQGYIEPRLVVEPPKNHRDSVLPVAPKQHHTGATNSVPGTALSLTPWLIKLKLV